jgi:hypothetical protein
MRVSNAANELAIARGTAVAPPRFVGMRSDREPRPIETQETKTMKQRADRACAGRLTGALSLAVILALPACTQAGDAEVDRMRDLIRQENALRSHRLRSWQSMRGEPGFIHADPTAVEVGTTEYELASLEQSIGIDRPVLLSSGDVWYPEGVTLPDNCGDLYLNASTEADLIAEDARFERCLIDSNLYEPSNPTHMGYMARYFREPLPASAGEGELDVETEDAWHCGYWVPTQKNPCTVPVNGTACPGKMQCYQQYYHPVWCSGGEADEWGVCDCIPDPGAFHYGSCVLDDPNCGQPGE